MDLQGHLPWAGQEAYLSFLYNVKLQFTNKWLASLPSPGCALPYDTCSVAEGCDWCLNNLNKSTGCTDGHSCMQFVTMMKCDVNANYLSQQQLNAQTRKLALLEISDGAVSWNMHITSLWWKLPEQLNWGEWRWTQVASIGSTRLMAGNLKYFAPKAGHTDFASSVTAHRPLNYLHFLFMCDICYTPAVTALQITVESCTCPSVATYQLTLTPSVMLLDFVMC